MVKHANLFMLILVIYIQALGSALVFFAFYSETYFNIAISIQILQPVSSVLSFAVPFAAYLLITKRKLSETLPLKPLNPVNLTLVVCISIAVIPVLMLISAVSSALFDNNAAVFLEEMMTLPAAAVMISVAVIPAVFEEIIFRGIILTNCKDIGIKKAAVISGLFFALIHMDLQQFFYAFVMGVILSSLVYYTKSIFAPVVSHFVVNASAIALSYAAADISETFPLLPALIISMPVLFMAFKYFVSYNEKNLTVEININDSAVNKVFTWEFWAVLCLYVIIAVIFI